LRSGLPVGSVSRAAVMHTPEMADARSTSPQRSPHWHAVAPDGDPPAPRRDVGRAHNAIGAWGAAQRDRSAVERRVALALHSEGAARCCGARFMRRSTAHPALWSAARRSALHRCGARHTASRCTPCAAWLWRADPQCAAWICKGQRPSPRGLGAPACRPSGPPGPPPGRRATLIRRRPGGGPSAMGDSGVRGARCSMRRTARCRARRSSRPYRSGPDTSAAAFGPGRFSPRIE
jgi:hypothetical protein